MQTSDNKAQYADATQKAGGDSFTCAEIASPPAKGFGHGWLWEGNLANK